MTVDCNGSALIIATVACRRAASGQSRAHEYTGEQSEESPGVRLLLHATALLVGSGELLMPMQWEDVGLHANDYGDVRFRVIAIHCN